MPHEEVVDKLITARRMHQVVDIEDRLTLLKKEMDEAMDGLVTLQRALKQLGQVQYRASVVYTMMLETALVASDQAHVIEAAKKGLEMMQGAMVAHDDSASVG